MMLSFTPISAIALAIVLLMTCISVAESVEIPAVHSGIYSDSDGRLYYVDPDGDTLYFLDKKARYTLDRMRRNPVGTENGIEFDFGISNMTGWLYYGFISGPDVVKHSYPVYFNRSSKIDSGKASIDIRNRMKGIYDFVNWKETGIIRLGYRIVDSEGQFLYDGKIMIRGTGPFVVDTSIVEGPFINMVTHNSAVVSFETNFATLCRVIMDGQSFPDSSPDTHHEIELHGLLPDTQYAYTTAYGNYQDTYGFRTAPEPGSRSPFTFAYGSDGRANNGGGERDIWGVNCYMMKRIAVVCDLKNARFLQFTGDLINGYTIDEGQIMLEYANWKRSVEPFACYFPFIAGFGNHESLLHYFRNGDKRARIDRFPFETESAEAVFARNFVNPRNGPRSEDGASYDPDPNATDFPPYGENAFYYSYANIVMISLNSNYWFSPTIERVPEIGGNLHGYLMDNQLLWLKSTLEKLEDDENVDHVFVTLHTPILPNGGHVEDDMWYNGNNSFRPYVAGKPVEKGIIERRDQLLDLLMNHSTKVVAALTGDEHNYNRLRLTEDTPIYLDDYKGDRLTEFRPIWLINNGAGGAPYYGQEDTPWMSHLEAFSTQNAVVFFHVDGDSITIEVINPDTMELIDQFQI